MRSALLVLVGAALVATGAEKVEAQSLGNVIKREAERETRRQAQRRTREAVQCATGAPDCLPEDESAKSTTPAAPATASAPAAPAPAASTGQVLDPFETSGTPAAAAAPFSVPAIAGATAVDHQAGTLASYRRITGFKPRQISYVDQTGLVTRTRYELTGGQTPSAAIAAWREPLLRQGFVVEWQCSRKAQCGSSAYHQLGAGYVPVNGINLGIAGDVEYFTARRAVQGQATIYVAVALNRNVAFVDVVEVAP